MGKRTYCMPLVKEKEIEKKSKGAYYMSISCFRG